MLSCFKSVQKMALRGPVDIYEVKRSQRHLWVAMENNWSVAYISEILDFEQFTLKIGAKILSEIFETRASVWN